MTAEIPYFYGSAENKLNSKGQVAIPARFRSVVPEDERNFVIIRGESDCLYMYTHRQFEKIKQNARHLAEEKDDGDFFRSFLAEACPVDIDGQGRFVLPQGLMREAGIAGPGVQFVGVDDRIEIWAPSVFAQRTGKTASYEATRRDNAKRIFGI